MNRVYGVLIFQSANTQLVPMLAESWELTSDLSTLTLHLATNVKFHDGTDFNAQAVNAHIERITDPVYGSELAARYKSVESVEIIDDLTLRLNLKEKNALILNTFSLRSGMVPSPTAVNSMSLEEYNRDPVGAGPFRFKSWVSDSNVVYEAWDQSFDPELPFVDALRINIIKDAAVALAAFRAGDLDILELNEDQVQLVKDKPGIELQVVTQRSMFFIAVNPHWPPLDDVRIRKAIALGIDQQALIEGVHRGLAVFNYGPCIWAAYPLECDSSFKKWEYDPVEARSLVVEAGYADGVTVGPVHWFSFGKPTSVLVAIQDMLKDIGINLELDPLEGRQATVKYQVNKEAAMYVSQSDTPADLDTAIRAHFHSQSPRYFAGGPSSKYAGQPVPGLDPALQERMDFLIDEAITLADPLERKIRYLEIQEIVTDNVLEVFRPITNRFVAVKDYVKGFLHSAKHGGGDNEFQTWLEKK